MFKKIISLVSGDKPAKDAKGISETTFCESCGEVCGATCRSEAILDRTKDKFQTGVPGRYR